MPSSSSTNPQRGAGQPYPDLCYQRYCEVQGTGLGLSEKLEFEDGVELYTAIRVRIPLAPWLAQSTLP